MQFRMVYWAPAAAADNNICQSQTPAGAGNMLLNGALVSGGKASLANGDTTDQVAGGCSQRRVRLTFAADETGHNFLIKGFRAADYLSSGALVAIQETIAGTTMGTVDTLQDFAEVNSVHIDAAATGAIKVGTSAISSTPWQKPSDEAKGEFNIGLAVALRSGTATFTVEHAMRKLPRAVTLPSQIPPVFTNSGYSSGKSASTDGNYAFPIEALRMSTSALSSGFLELSWKQSNIVGN